MVLTRVMLERVLIEEYRECVTCRYGCQPQLAELLALAHGRGMTRLPLEGGLKVWRLVVTTDNLAYMGGARH